MDNGYSRRQVLTLTGAALGASALAPPAEAPVNAQDTPATTAAEPSPARNRSAAEPFGYCFNTSTVRGQKLPLSRVVEITAGAGYDAIEPWIDEILRHVEGGGPSAVADMARRIKDAGLVVPSAICFAEWIVDDDARRAKGLETAKRDMDLVSRLGGRRIAAPPLGAQAEPTLDLAKAAERYRALCELGDQFGVSPMAEVWGFSTQLRTLGQAGLVALDSRHPRACVLADTYHLYKGGSGFDTLKLLSPASLQHFHVNDYPADPPRERIADKHRVYPGDGVAPLAQQFRTLRDLGFTGMLSLELFNEDYYKQDPLEVARTGLEKTRAAVRKALG